MTAAAQRPEPMALVRREWDPFALMDRLDDKAILAELEGIANDVLVYRIRDESGKEVLGLSKGGIDECCNILAHRGEVVREISMEHTIMGEGEEREALFTVIAARYAVSQDGREVKLDQVIGTKAQPLYFEAALPLSIDSPCPGKKPVKDGHRRTFREMLEQERGYLEWMAANFRDEATAAFVGRILQGEDATVQPGRQKNRFWFEQGSTKAGRNARSRLVPAQIKAEVIARAKQAGQEKVVEAREPEQRETSAAPAAAAPAAASQPAAADAPRWPFKGNLLDKPLADVSTEDLTAALPFARRKDAERYKGFIAAAEEELERRRHKD